MRLPGSRIAVPWPEDVVARIAIVFAALPIGGAVAQRFGFERGWGSVVAVWAVALIHWVLVLVRELPRRGGAVPVPVAHALGVGGRILGHPLVRNAYQLRPLGRLQRITPRLVDDWAGPPGRLGVVRERSQGCRLR